MLESPKDSIAHHLHKLHEKIHRQVTFNNDTYRFIVIHMEECRNYLLEMR